MTREEAIESIQDFTGWFKKDKPIYKALEMAIKALEQEPCDDVVSRQAVLDIVGDMYGLARPDVLSATINQIKSLTSVRPQEQTGHWEFFCQHWRKCSECGYPHKFAEEWDYCPNCGACLKDGRTLDEFIEDSKESEDKR